MTILRYVVSTASLLSIILGSLNAAGSEINHIGTVSDVQACVSETGILEDIVISHTDEQKTICPSHYSVYLDLIERILPRHEPLLGWPYRGCSRQGGFNTSRESGFFDFIFDFMQLTMYHASVIDNTHACMRNSGWSEAVVFEPITQYDLSIWLVWSVASGEIFREFKAIENRANIGPNLTRFSISGHDEDESRYYGIKRNSSEYSYLKPDIFPVVILALFATFLIFFCQGFKMFVKNGKWFGIILMLLGWGAGFIGGGLWVFGQTWLQGLVSSPASFSILDSRRVGI